MRENEWGLQLIYASAEIGVPPGSGVPPLCFVRLKLGEDSPDLKKVGLPGCSGGRPALLHCQ